MRNLLTPNFIFISKFFLIIILFGFLSCKDDDNAVNGGATGTVNGTLNLPAEANSAVWYLLVDNDINGDNGSVSMGTGTCGSGTTVSYNIENVPTGVYYIYAVVFVASDGRQGPQTGDYLGIYGSDFSNNIPGNPNANVSTGTNTFDIDLVIMQ